MAELIKLYDAKFPKMEGDEFSMFLCDPESSDEKQKQLLRKLLDHKHSSAKPWFEYISYVQNSAPMHNKRKLMLIRLLNRSMNAIDEENYKEDKYYLQLVKVCLN